jgi:hypothetical protein
VQFTHVPLLTAPDTVEYVPLVQLLHAIDPDREYEPATHIWHAADDPAATTVEYVPESQLRHVALLFAPDMFEYLPAGQLMHADANDKPNVPAGHTRHAADDAAPGVAV